MEKYIIDAFINKHGKKIFNDIKTMIQNELKYSKSAVAFNDNYLSYIFEIATYEYCGIEDKKIPTFISKMGNDYTPEISYTELKEIHQKSIQEIIKYLEKSTNNIIE